ncbi:MAG: beta-lactamase family protein, partial [bacterium]|nr:beta-lactamase family protein [bacterium]
QFEWCGGGLITTSRDLAKWAKLLYEGNVFSQNSLDNLLKPVNYRTGQPDTGGYGLGVFVFNTPDGLIYGHHGIFPGYETSMLYVPELKTGIAMQINADSFSRKLDKPINQYLINEILPLIRDYLNNKESG